MCSLCSSSERCEYETGSRHIEALKCLLNKGQVAYVSSFDATNFFNVPENAEAAKEHAYLCPNGTLKPINDGLPCTWLRQPWPVIISNSVQTVEISNQINAWMHGNSNWESTLREIIKVDNFVPANIDMQYPKDYFGICMFTSNVFYLNEPQLNELFFSLLQSVKYLIVKHCVQLRHPGVQLQLKRKKNVKLYEQLV